MFNTIPAKNDMQISIGNREQSQGHHTFIRNGRKNRGQFESICDGLQLEGLWHTQKTMESKSITTLLVITPLVLVHVLLGSHTDYQANDGHVDLLKDSYKLIAVVRGMVKATSRTIPHCTVLKIWPKISVRHSAL